VVFAGAGAAAGAELAAVVVTLAVLGGAGAGVGVCWVCTGADAVCVGVCGLGLRWLGLAGGGGGSTVTAGGLLLRGEPDGKDRLREYMPHRSLHPMMLRVQGSRYPKFLIKEVMPFVARTYRVAAGREYVGLGGSSLGALISLYTATVRPGVIGRLLLESPSLGPSNRQISRERRGIKRWPERAFLAFGTAEAGR